MDKIALSQRTDNEQKTKNKTEKESLERKEGKQECLWSLQVMIQSFKKQQSSVLNNARRRKATTKSLMEVTKQKSLVTLKKKVLICGHITVTPQ